MWLFQYIACIYLLVSFFTNNGGFDGLSYNFLEHIYDAPPQLKNL